MKTDQNTTDNLTTIGLGGGCHWCTEAVFSSLNNIISVKQGWIASNKPNATFSEAVQITIDERKISLQDIIEIHLYTHSSSSKHAMRHKYRSAVYAKTEKDKQRIKDILENLQKVSEEPLITEALLLKNFKQSEEKYRDYFYKNPNKQFCQTFIQPKLKKLMQRHRHIADQSKISHNL